MNNSDFKAHMNAEDTQAKVRWLALDPGTTHTGWVIYDPEEETLLEAGWEENSLVLWRIDNMGFHDRIVIESFAAQGMPLGDSSLETLRWEGRFTERAKASRQIDVDRITRREVKLIICGSTRAKDSNIKAALVDRFASEWEHKGHGKGTKADPSPLWKLYSSKGASKHTYAALAVGVAWSLEYWRK